MPQQKPGRSEQSVGTPPEFLYAVKKRLCIGNFDVDLAADTHNAVCANYYDEQMDALADNNSWKVTQGGWAWCNPPYGKISPWVEKASKEAAEGAHIAILVPASVGSNWWRDHVEPYAYQSFLNGRLTFLGHTSPYPKDLALLLYTPWCFTGHEIWYWRNGLHVE